VLPRLALNSQFLCFCLTKAEMTGVSHHALAELGFQVLHSTTWRHAEHLQGDRSTWEVLLSFCVHKFHPSK
jgi:hypothetical protein